MRGPRVWDQSGMPMGEGDEGVIKERISLDKSNANILRDEMTTTDTSLTRPDADRRSKSCLFLRDAPNSRQEPTFDARQDEARLPR